MRLLLEDRIKALQDNPNARLAKIGVSPGMRVVDVGAGKGLYSLLSSMIVGREGAVFAVEPDRSRAAVITKRASQEGLVNVNVLTTGAENLTEIPSLTIDIAFALNSMHHFNDKGAAFAEVNRVLRVGGRFYVRDMIKTWFRGHGIRREEIPGLPVTGYSSKQIELAGSKLEATFTK